MHCFPIRFPLRGLMLSLALGAAVGAASAEEGALSQLYAARPPAGSSFVRVVNPSPAKLQVRVAEGPVQRVGGELPATSYAIVAGGRRFSVQVDGKPTASLEVKPNTFSTLVLRREGARFAFTPIDDTAETPDALKAELRFYNLAEGCAKAQLALSPAGTPVFRDVAAGASAARSVNPVKASLSGQCGEAATAAQALPALQPGDYLSLFLVGPAGKPVLVMQPSRTDPVKR